MVRLESGTINISSIFPMFTILIQLGGFIQLSNMWRERSVMIRFDRNGPDRTKKRHKTAKSCIQAEKNVTDYRNFSRNTEHFIYFVTGSNKQHFCSPSQQVELEFSYFRRIWHIQLVLRSGGTVMSSLQMHRMFYFAMPLSGNWIIGSIDFLLGFPPMFTSLL